LITADQEIRSAALCKVQKGLIVGVPAPPQGCTSFRPFDHLAVREIVGQQLPRIVGRKPKFWVTENPRDFRGGRTRDQRHATTFAPMLTQPSQAAIRK